MLKFIYYRIQTLFILCSFLLQRHRKLICTFVKPKREGVVRILSLPSTVHNFRPQISVHRFPSTDFRLQISVHRFLSTDHNFRLHCTLTILIHCSLARMNELKMRNCNTLTCPQNAGDAISDYLDLKKFPRKGASGTPLRV